VPEAEAKRVEHLAMGFEMAGLGQALVLAMTVDGIAEQGIAKEFEVNPDLVSAAGMESGFDQGGALETLLHAVAGVGFASVFLVDDHAFAVGTMPGDRGANLPFVALDLAADNREIQLLNLAAGKLGGEGEMSFVVLGYDQAAAGVFVQPMDDAWARHTPDAAQFSLAVMEQRIDESESFMPGGGVDDHAWRFIQDQESVIFVEDA
jgi:hypothetical protein